VAAFFVACGDATKLFKIAEEGFDEMTPFVHVEIAGNLAGTVADPGIEFHCEHPSSPSMPFKDIETA
jgi:hypothetical protein